MIHIDTEAAVQRVLKLMAIPGASGDEREVAEAIIAELSGAGIDPANIQFDDANERTRIKGQVGNLIVHIPGMIDAPARLFSAHMDTVPICVGSKPRQDADVVSSADPATGLGADDRSGCASILTAAVETLRSQKDHPPLVFAWFIQEEVGLEGARHLDTSRIGPVGSAFNFDGGTVEKLTVGATGGERMEIVVSGLPAHAGLAPETGISAIAACSLAIERLHRTGWHGRIEKPEGSGTSNVGVITGGQATNVVTPEVKLRAEARSHDSAMRQRIVQEIRDAFQWAVSEVKNTDGACGKLSFQSHVDYESFRIEEDEPVVLAAAEAVRSIGREPYCEIAGGGLDANWLFQHGIRAVSLGCGQRNIHTAQEQLIVSDYLDACRIATELVGLQ